MQLSSTEFLGSSGFKDKLYAGSVYGAIDELLIQGSPGSNPEAVMKREALLDGASVVWKAPGKAAGAGQLVCWLC